MHEPMYSYKGVYVLCIWSQMSRWAACRTWRREFRRVFRRMARGISRWVARRISRWTFRRVSVMAMEQLSPRMLATGGQSALRRLVLAQERLELI